MTKNSIYKTPDSNLRTSTLFIESKITFGRVLSLWWALAWRWGILSSVLFGSFFGIMLLIDMERLAESSIFIFMIFLLYSLIFLASLFCIYWVLKQPYGKYKLVLINTRE